MYVNLCGAKIKQKYTQVAFAIYAWTHEITDVLITVQCCICDFLLENKIHNTFDT